MDISEWDKSRVSIYLVELLRELSVGASGSLYKKPTLAIVLTE